jgi:hypothetical protein
MRRGHRSSHEGRPPWINLSPRPQFSPLSPWHNAPQYGILRQWVMAQCATMITKIPYEVWYCDACETVWLPRRGREEEPKRCPNRNCRKLASWRNLDGVRRGEGGSKQTTDPSQGNRGDGDMVSKRCRLCGKKLITWGAQLRCEACKRNWPTE